MGPITKAQTEMDTIVADADYFHVKARQCFRLARQAADDGTAEILRDTARSFEQRAAASTRAEGGPVKSA